MPTLSMDFLELLPIRDLGHPLAPGHVRISKKGHPTVQVAPHQHEENAPMTSTPGTKISLITGASSGIGQDLAVTLARRGTDSLVLVGRDQARLDSVASHCGDADVLCVIADLGEAGGPAQVVEAALQRFGRIDRLVVNAGMYFAGELDEASPENIEALLSTNVTGAIQLVRAALPSMRAAGSGDIVLVTSVSGYQDIHWEPVYSASKHAMVSFAHTLRRQLINTGLRVMSVGPGVVLTELWGFSPGDERIREETNAGRGIEVSQVTETICFMLDRPAHVTIRDVVIIPSNQDI